MTDPSPSRPTRSVLLHEVAELRSTVTDLIGTVVDLDKNQSEETRKRKQAVLVGVLSAALFLAALAYSIFVTTQLRDIAAKNRKTSAGNAEIIREIQAATGPAAQARSAQSTSDVLGRVDASNRVVAQAIISEVAALLEKPAPTIPPSPTTTLPPPLSGGGGGQGAGPPPTTPRAPTTTTTAPPRSPPTTRPPPPPTTTVPPRPPLVCVLKLCV